MCNVSGWLAESQQIQCRGNILLQSNTSIAVQAAETFLQANNLIGELYKR